MADETHDHEHDEVDEELARRRVERLRNAVLTAPPDLLRAALQRMPEPTVREVAAATGTPAPVLRRSNNPATRLRRATDPKHLAVVAEAFAGPCLVATVDLLGDAADDPSYNQLAGAVDVIAETHAPAEIAAMLAYVAATGQKAAGSCDRILDEDERFAVAEPSDTDEEDEEDVAPRLVAPLPPERHASAEVKAARKARRQKEKEERRRVAEATAKAAAAARQRAKQSGGGDPASG